MHNPLSSSTPFSPPHLILEVGSTRFPTLSNSLKDSRGLYLANRHFRYRAASSNALRQTSYLLLTYIALQHLAHELEELELVVHIISIELTVDDEESIVRMYAFGEVKLGLPWMVNRMPRGRRLRRGV